MRLINRKEGKSKKVYSVSELKNGVVYQRINNDDELIIIKRDDSYIVLHNGFQGRDRVDEFDTTNLNRNSEFIEVPKGTILEYEV